MPEGVPASASRGTHRSIRSRIFTTRDAKYQILWAVRAFLTPSPHEGPGAAPRFEP